MNEALRLFWEGTPEDAATVALCVVGGGVLVLWILGRVLADVVKAIRNR